MTARRSRPERTMAEAEAWREGYEAAKAQACAVMKTLRASPDVRPDLVLRPDFARGWVDARIVVYHAIARMEPEAPHDG